MSATLRECDLVCAILEPVQAQQDSIQSALIGQLKQHRPQQAEALRRTLCEGLAESLAGLAEHEQGSGDTHLRHWAGHQAELAWNMEMPCTVLLAGLDELGNVLRADLLAHPPGGLTLPSALAQLESGLVLLRAMLVEACLGADRQPLAALVDESRQWLCVATSKGRPVLMNPEGRRLLGLDAKTLPASMQDCFSEASWKTVVEVALPQVKKTGRWQGSTQLRHLPDGELLDVETTLVLVRNPVGGVPLCLAWSARDEGLQQYAAEVEERKNVILSPALDPILTVDHQGLVTEFNREAERTFKRPRSEVVGKKPEEILFPHTEGKEGWVERYVSAREGSMLGKRTEITAVRSDGETFPAEMAMTISVEQGLPVFTFFLRDITERKRAEEALTRHAAELGRSNAALAERNEELKQFAYVASHDLQEPLRAVSSYCQLLKRRYAGQLDQDADEFINFAVDGATRMQALINGLLEYSRVGTAAFELEPVEVQSVVEEALSNLEAPLKETGAAVRTEGLPKVYALRLQLVQLFQNLIGNASNIAAPSHRRSISWPSRRVASGYLWCATTALASRKNTSKESS